MGDEAPTSAAFSNSPFYINYYNVLSSLIFHLQLQICQYLNCPQFYPRKEVAHLLERQKLKLTAVKRFLVAVNLARIWLKASWSHLAKAHTNISQHFEEIWVTQDLTFEHSSRSQVTWNCSKYLLVCLFGNSSWWQKRLYYWLQKSE